MVRKDYPIRIESETEEQITKTKNLPLHHHVFSMRLLAFANSCPKMHNIYMKKAGLRD